MIKKVLIIGALTASLVGSLYLVKRTQEVRRGAAGDVDFSFGQSSYEVNSAGEVVNVNLKADSGSNKVDLVALSLSYDAGLEIEDVSLGALSNELNVAYGGGQVTIETAETGNWQELPSGEFTVATVRVKVNSNGSINFDSALANGCIPSGESCEVTQFSVSTNGTNFVISEAEPTNTSAPVEEVIHLLFDPSAYEVSSAGEVVTASLRANSGSNKVDLAALNLSYTSGLTIEGVDLVALPSELNVTYGGGQLTIEAAKSSSWEDLPGGNFTIARIRVRVNNDGEINFNSGTVNGCTPQGSNCEVIEFDERMSNPTRFTVAGSEPTNTPTQGPAPEVDVYFDPSSYEVSSSGGIALAYLKGDAGDNRVDVVGLNLDYDSGLEVENVSLADLPNELNVTYGGGQLTIEAAKLGTWQELPSGVFDIATIRVRVNSEGGMNFSSATASGCVPSGSGCDVTSFSTSTSGVDFFISGGEPTNTPTPTGEPEEKPDLIVTDIWDEYSHGRVWIKYSVKNEGEVTAGGDWPAMYNALYVDGDYVVDDRMASVFPGNTRTSVFGYEWSCSGSSDIIQVCADKDNDIEEWNGGNNCRTETMVCEEPTDTPTSTPADTPTPTDTPEPTPTGEVGCKPCPDGRFVGSVADYDCDGDVDMEDFAGWYDDYKLDSQNLYGDFNCNGQLDQADVNQWYEELPKFE